MHKLIATLLLPLTLFLTPAISEGVGPVTTAFVVDHYLKEFPYESAEEATEFRLGALFPNIHLLGTLSQEELLLPATSLQDVREEPFPFLAGMKFQALIQGVKARFFAENGFSDIIANLPIDHPGNFVDFLEDEVLFPLLKIEAWKDLLILSLEQELEWGISKEELDRWHSLLTLTYTYYPSTLILLAHLRGEGLLHISKEELATWNDTFAILSKSQEAKQYVNSLMKLFAFHLKKEQQKPF